MAIRTKDLWKNHSWIQCTQPNWIKVRFPYFVFGFFSGWLLTPYYIPTFIKTFPLTQCTDIPGNNLTNVFPYKNETSWVKDAKIQVNRSQLLDIAELLDEAVIGHKPPSEELRKKFHKLFHFLDPQYKKVSTINVSNDVCTESYKGKRGWVTNKCTQGKPLSQLIEVLLYYSSCEANLSTVLVGIRRVDPNITVRIAVRNFTNSSCMDLKSQFRAVTVIGVEDMNSGVMWTRLASMVSTPYLLVGRDLDSFDGDFSSLSRQIRVLGTTSNVQVVGGAFRNQSGYWHVGCFQSQIRNYALTYQDGYFVSRNECMYCDHLLGPFVTRTSILKKIPLSDSLPAALLFEDWFLQVRSKRMYVMNCPDVMYLATDPNAEEKQRKSDLWIPLARKWELGILNWPPGTSHVFTCTEAGITCQDTFSIIYTRLMPLCCVKEMASKLSILETFFSNRSIPYEVFSGAVLGAVKFADFTPWDIDFDITYALTYRKTIVDAKELFAFHGLTLGSVDEYRISGFCRLFTRNNINVTANFYFEMLPYLKTPSVGYRQTRINFHGVWVNGPTNPGLYARNRYGHDMLKHAQGHRHTKKGDNEYDPYAAGQFLPCKSDHHACLDRYSTDGSLGFKVT